MVEVLLKILKNFTVIKVLLYKVLKVSDNMTCCIIMNVKQSFIQSHVF